MQAVGGVWVFKLRSLVSSREKKEIGLRLYLLL